MPVMVQHKCGHDEEHRLRSDSTEETAREYWEKRPCTPCWQEEKNPKRPEGLPDLAGTARQIPWAENIRSRVLSKLSKGAWGPLADMTDAHWWIDRDRLSIKELVACAEIKLTKET